MFSPRSAGGRNAAAHPRLSAADLALPALGGRSREIVNQLKASRDHPDLDNGTLILSAPYAIGKATSATCEREEGQGELFSPGIRRRGEPAEADARPPRDPARRDRERGPARGLAGWDDPLRARPSPRRTAPARPLGGPPGMACLPMRNGHTGSRHLPDCGARSRTARLHVCPSCGVAAAESEAPSRRAGRRPGRRARWDQRARSRVR